MCVHRNLNMTVVPELSTVPLHRILSVQSIKKTKKEQQKKNQHTPQDKTFFLNQILFVNSAK